MSHLTIYARLARISPEDALNWLDHQRGSRIRGEPVEAFFRSALGFKVRPLSYGKCAFCIGRKWYDLRLPDWAIWWARQVSQLRSPEQGYRIEEVRECLEQTIKIIRRGVHTP